MQFNRKILYLEDHEDTRELVSLVLRNEGYSLISDNTFSGALALAQTTSFDLIMLDNSLVDGSGLEFCRRVREFDAVTPILFYSGGAYESDKLNAARAGAQGYLVKPCSFSELLRTISDLIARSASPPPSQPEVAEKHASNLKPLLGDSLSIPDPCGPRS